MTVTVYGPIATADGATLWVDEIVHQAPGDRLIVEQRQRYGTLRADQFDPWQPGHVPVDIEHTTDELGRLVYLEHDQNLTAVAVLDLEPDDLAELGPLKLSTVTATNRMTGSVQLRSIAIVPAANAAAVGLSTFEWIDGDIRRGALRTIGIGQIPPILKRAADWCRHHRAANHLKVVERRPPVIEEQAPYAHPDHSDLVPRSNSGRYKTIDGRRVEIEYSAPYYGPVTVR